ncbi:aminoacyl-tRNA hydrolase [Curvivirga sp.]|uniref:aminoacyl-tRNA hydrolase n=1 Tax=Curvivirga sp. TaxID=2856848 RepID=UPI003B5AEDA4
MLLLVGLGNPGPKYENNRHNIGFMAVDELVRRHSSFGPWKSRFQGMVSEGRIGTEKVLLLKPHTYMNNSGQAVGEAMRFYKLESQDVFVIYDELDIQPGRLKVKFAGGHGGHNGLRSMDAHIGKDYTRIRLGIGHPGDKNKVSNYVLGDFGKQDRDLINRQIDAVIDALPELLEAEDINKGSGKFMTKVSVIMNPPANQKKSETKDALAAAKNSAPQKVSPQQKQTEEAKPTLSGLAAAFQKAKDKLNNS